MQLKFIGTSSGKTSLNRYHSSLLFFSNDFHFLIDAGDGISKALLKEGVNFSDINSILFSHLHPDHYTGLAALIVQMKMQQRTKPLSIYVYKSLIEIINNFLTSSYLLPERMGFEIAYIPFEDNETKVIKNDFKFTARKNTHLSELETKSSNKELSFYSASFLIEVNEQKIFYTADIGSADDLLLFNDYKIDLLISEIAHINLQQILERSQSINSRKVYLTHYSDEDAGKIKAELEKMSFEEREKVFLAEDGLSFEI